MGLLTGSGIAIRDSRISSTSQLSLLPPAMRFQCNVSISIKPSPQFHSHLQLQLSTNQKLMVVSALGDGGIDGETQRNSPLEVEIQRCYQFVRRLGRGVWDLRPSQVKPTHPHYLLALELSREVGKMLDCTTWTGAGPGLMNAVIRSALQAKKPVGGFKIGRRFFTARKRGLVDAVVRNDQSEKTAIVALAGGIGTADEICEILALIQLERLGLKFPIPFVLLN